MTVERRIQITAVILIIFVLGTVSVLFWSSRQVEEGIKRTESTSQAIQSAFMLSVLLNDYLDHGGKRTLRQWKKHSEVLGQILKDMNSESIDSELLTNFSNKLEAVNSLSPQIMRLKPSGATGDEHQDSRAKDITGSTSEVPKRTFLLHSRFLVGTLTKDTTPTRPAPLISTTHTRHWTI